MQVTQNGDERRRSSVPLQFQETNLENAQTPEEDEEEEEPQLPAWMSIALYVQTKE